MKTGFKFILYVIIIGCIGWWIVQEQERKEELANVPMPTELHPVVNDKTNQLIAKAASAGIDIVITDGFRSVEDQDEIYERGRSVEGSIVSHAKGGESYHNYGLAVDFAIRTNEDNVVWDMEYDGNQNGESDWMEVVDIAKELGFAWGGDWQGFKDYPHLEMRFGLSIRELQRGERPD